MDVSILERRGAVDAAGSAAAVSRALGAMSAVELLRLGALARLRARGLPAGIEWSDLLNEALARALDGSRQWPQGVPFLVFLAGVMRSVCADIWRRRRREAELIAFGGRGDDGGDGGGEVACPAADQERVLAACEAVAAIFGLFAGDVVALRIISGLANGQTAEEIRVLHGLSEVEYDSARRRMRRALLRAGFLEGAR